MYVFCGTLQIHTSLMLALQALQRCRVGWSQLNAVEPLYKGHSKLGHLSNEDTVCSPNHIELGTNLPLN